MKCFTVRKKPNYAPIIVLLSVFCAFTAAWIMEKVDAIHNPVYLAIGIGVCVACLCIYILIIFFILRIVLQLWVRLLNFIRVGYGKVTR